MPQLNPAPWFLIFILAWITFTILHTKVLKNTPSPMTSQYNQHPNKKPLDHDFKLLQPI